MSSQSWHWPDVFAVRMDEVHDEGQLSEMGRPDLTEDPLKQGRTLEQAFGIELPSEVGPVRQLRQQLDLW